MWHGRECGGMELHFASKIQAVFNWMIIFTCHKTCLDFAYKDQKLFYCSHFVWTRILRESFIHSFTLPLYPKIPWWYCECRVNSIVIVCAFISVKYSVSELTLLLFWMIFYMNTDIEAIPIIDYFHPSHWP